MNQRDVDRYLRQVERGDGCWRWLGSISHHGYGVFYVDGAQVRATHMALRADGRPPVVGHFALHRCDNRPCVNPAHLYWGTHEQNMRDRMVRGRTARGDRMHHQRVHGERHPKAKLTDADVLAIRRAYRPGLGGQLMRQYGVSQSAISAIVNHDTWKHLPREAVA